MSHNGKLYIETVGCQMNVLDSELVVAALRQAGYSLTPEPKDADTVLFNTCSVREHAEQKIYSAVGRLKYSKQSRPEQVIGVIGCMAQKDQDQIFRRAPHVDLVVGTGQLAEIPRLVDEARRTRTRQLAVSLGRSEGNRAAVARSFTSYDPLRDPEMRPSPWQAYVRIMIGCDKFCTYCVVPATRGPEQSRPPEQIAREVRVLVDQGVREVTLLGQTVNSYKFTEGGRTSRLSDLLRQIHETPGLERIKFVTNFPQDMTDDLLQAVADLPKVARYLHVPLQAGCDDVLRRMKRLYTVSEYRDMMHRIREFVPGCAVSSDFIVGFCGESEESFQKSIDAVREFRFKNSFIFKYSPRPGTKAHALYADDVPDEVKRRRNQELLAVQTEISAEENAAFIGREVKVLVEGPSKKALAATNADSLPGWHAGADAAHDARGESDLVDLDGAAEATAEPASNGGQGHRAQLVGRTPCDRIVVFDGNPRLAGTIAAVEIDDCSATTLLGSIATLSVQHGSHGLLPVLQ